MKGQWLFNTARTGFLRPAALIAFVAFALLPSRAAAHDAGLVTPSELFGWQAFLPDALTFFVLVLLLTVHSRGAARTAVRPAHRLAFCAGLLVLLIAVSPAVEAIAYALLSFHMLQHLLLLVVSAPLLAYSRPQAPLLLGLPAPIRRRLVAGGIRRPLRHIGGLLVHPIPALVLASGVLWLWHAPVFYQATLHHQWLHVLEHTLFLATGVLFWAALLPATRRARARSAGGLLILFAMSVQGAMLGALLAFSSTLWFEHYSATSSHWGVSVMDDQQFAGLLMWMLGGLVYAGAAAALLATGLAELEGRMQRESLAVPRENVAVRKAGTSATRRTTHEV